MVNNTVTWADTKHSAINLLDGELPNAATEQALIDAFELEPAAVLKELRAVAADKRAGKVRSGWAVWKTRCQTVLTQKDTQVVIGNNRSKELHKAEQWIRNAGGYIDREDELIAELYDEHLGALRHWPDTRPQIVALWLEHRHRFAKAEREAEERGRRHIELMGRLRPNSTADSPH